MLKYLYLNNFRNYENLEFRPDGSFIILTGANGTGKSNLLEGIHYLGTGYSFRQARDDNLVRFGSDYFAISGIVSCAGVDYKIDVLYQKEKRKKVIRINNKRVLPGSCSSYLPVVIFSPQDLILIKGAPSGRRRFLDLLVSQLKPQHSKDLHYYNTVLLQRNKLLRGTNTTDADLLPWEQQLSSIGARIWKRRVSVFSQLIDYSSEVFASLSRGRILRGEYKTQVNGIKESDDLEKFQYLFLNEMQKARPVDRKVKFTTVGPHREDFHLYLNDHDARLYASQGEQRLISLALKVGQYRLLISEKRTEPVLLLDDVFSELDEKHRILVLDVMKKGSQVIATTTASFKEEYGRREALTGHITMVYPKNFS
ncbi:MAG TPA: DNA replication/repair protein RecF [Syntrophaceticus sp.]|nr:DNA replication/repair protein RecF [Syntrophaceticus sp.]